MSDTEDKWPRNYNPGPPKHLHALGVIAITLANFQAAMDSLYLSKAAEVGLPPELSTLYYFALNDEKRLAALKVIFEKYEKDSRIVDLICNLIKYLSGVSIAGTIFCTLNYIRRRLVFTILYT
jgi:hypothetical protein